jgi:hypothetical protein
VTIPDRDELEPQGQPAVTAQLDDVIYQRTTEAPHRQTPQKWLFEVERSLYVARNPRPATLRPVVDRSVSEVPLGATWDETGTTFALFSGAAERVQVCLFGDGDGEDERRIDLTNRGEGRWETRLPGIRPGQRYGFRVDGPFEPARGLFCNPAKLLLDPCARAIVGQVQWHRAVFRLPVLDRRGATSAVT